MIPSLADGTSDLWLQVRARERRRQATQTDNDTPAPGRGDKVIRPSQHNQLCNLTFGYLQTPVTQSSHEAQGRHVSFFNAAEKNTSAGLDYAL